MVMKRESTHREQRRTSLLQAAQFCFGKKGYHATQISDIIAKAKVARGTFYLYFKSKREIFKALMEELLKKVTGQIQTLPRDAVEKIPAQLLGNIQRVTTLLFSEPLLTRLLFSEAVGLDKEQDAQLRNFYNRILDYIQRGLRQGQEMGFVRKGNVPVMALCLLGSLKEIFYQSVLQTEKPQAEEVTQEVFRTVAGAVIDPTKFFLVEEFLTQG